MSSKSRGSDGIVGRMMSGLLDRFRRSGGGMAMEEGQAGPVGADFLDLSGCIGTLSTHISPERRLNNHRALQDSVERVNECVSRIHASCLPSNSTQEALVGPADFSNDEGPILSLAAEVVGHLYIHQANNSRLFQKCKQVLEKLRSLRPHTGNLVEEMFLKLISAPSSSGQGMSVEDLSKVSSLLESSDLFQGFLRSNFHQVLSAVAVTLCCEIEKQTTLGTGRVQPSRVPAADACYQAAKVFLQMCQHGQNDLRPLLWNPSYGCHEDVYQTISGLLTLLEDQRFSKDCGLMAGSCLAMMSNSAPHPRQAAEAVANLLERYSSNRSPHTLQIGQFVLSATPLRPRPPSGPPPLPAMMFPRLAVARGVLTCCNKAILLEHVSANQEHQLLCTEILFPVVCELCKAADGELKYHATEALKLYLQALKPILSTILRDSSRPRLCGPDTAHTRAVLGLVWQELQSPVDGVAEMIRSALSNLLDLHLQENKGRDGDNAQLLNFVTSSLLSTAWHIKGRYHLLASLVPRLGALRLLQARPALPRELLRCLATNYLAAAATELHNALVRRLKEDGEATSSSSRRGEIRRRGQADGGREEAASAERWGSLWRDVMLEGICSDDSLVRYHTAKHWLPAALKSFPGCYGLLMGSLVKESTNQHLETQDDEGTDVRKLHARAVLLKYARINNLLDSDWLGSHHETISAGLWHAEDEIQADALACLCCSPKKSELPSEEATLLLRRTLPHLLNSDSAAFRNQLRHSVGAFVGRTCDGSLILVKRLRKLESKMEIGNLRQEEGTSGSNARRGLSDAEQLSAVKERLRPALDCLDWLVELCFGSLFPGACYQRKRTAFDILGVVFEALLAGSKQEESKDISSESLMAWALDRGKCDLLSARNASLLLECVQDGSNDLRSSSYHLLATYFPATLPSSPTYPNTSSSQVLCLALQLVSSPKLQESEAGALIAKLIFYKHSVVRCLQKLDNDLRSPSGSPVKSNGPSPENGPVHFLQSLLTSLAFQLKCCKKNLLQAAAVTPMHGLIRAIRRCLTDHPPTLARVFASDPASWSCLVAKLLSTVRDVARFVLLVLSGGRDTDEDPVADEDRRFLAAPSFGQMGEAIEKLIGDLAACWVGGGGEASQEGGGGGREEEEMLTLSEEHRLILACCWLNLKECSLLLGALVETMPLCGEGDPGIVTFDQLTLITNILMDVLTRCRHKGAIEGCNQGFAKLCSRLQSSHCAELQAIPRTFLDRVLGMVSQVGAGSSFTKKSAGLPLLVESIVSAEPRGRERPLLTYVMGRLMDIAGRPLPPRPNESLDLPQAHALNVLMALFRCSAVGTDILRHCSGAVEMAIGGFASPCWMIRNCSMRLFVTLIARIFGQKKVHDEHSQINAMSAATFFARYPTLKQFLLEEVRQFGGGRAEPLGGDDRGTRSKVAAGESDPGDRRSGRGRGVLRCGADDAGAGRRGDARCRESGGERGGEKGGLFLHPSLHPVLTLLSKLGPGVGSDDVQSLHEFTEPVRRLAGSSIYAVRELAARSLVPLIPPCDVPRQIGGIVDQLTGGARSVRDFNRLHGDLLQVEKLFEVAQRNESFQLDDLVLIQTKLSARTWIAGDSNPCAPIRALFVNVALAVVAECHRVCPGSGAMTCASSVMATVREHFKGAPPPFQIGIATLNIVMSTAYLRLITLTSNALTPDLLTSARALLTSCDPDVKLATLAHLHCNTRDILDQADVHGIRSLREDLAKLLTDARLDAGCLEKALALWVDLGHGAGPGTQPPCDWQCLWNVLTGLAEGQRGSGLLAAALPAIGQMLQWNLQTNQDSRVYVDVWCSWMVEYSHASQSETKRLATVQSMRIAAPIVWSKIADEHSEDQIDIALNLMVALLRLLQDEDQHVRLAAAGVVSSRLHRGAGRLWFGHLHCSAARQVLVDYLCETFLWSPKFMTSVLGLLQGSAAISEATQQPAASGTHLFGPESANIYAEDVMETRMLQQALVEVVERQQSANPGGFRSWLGGWCDATTRLVDAQKELTITQLILETELTMGASSEMSGGGQAYQVVYRQLRYVRFLCETTERVGWDEVSLRAMNEIHLTVKQTAEMPSVHPCLKTELLSLSQFIASQLETRATNAP